MAFILRRLVSTNKRRYQMDGYDLDLSYITPRVIAMGFPCDGVQRFYRNPADDVVRFLEERHAGHYKVYNLCVERGYNPRVFKGRVMRVPMYDGQAPPLQLMLEVCRDAAAWLAAHPAHVVAVHCKAGKGRTGAVVCAMLLALDPELGPTSMDNTLALWAERRTKDGKGLTIPSQRRFFGYFHSLLLTARADGALSLSNSASPVGALIGAQDCAAARPQLPLSTAAAVPPRAVRLLRVRFRGLPPWLLRDCTASVWWRPVGHHEAHTVCHVHTGAEAGCTGPSPGAATPGLAAGGAAWVVRPCNASSEASGGASSGGELCLDLAALAPLPSPPPPTPLPYYTPCTYPSGDRGLKADGGGPSASDDTAAGNGSSASPKLPPPTPNPEAADTRTLSSAGQGTHFPNAGAATKPLPGAGQGPPVNEGEKKAPPVVAGDIKVQLFRGALADPPHDVFKGSVTQFSAWVCTSFLDPRVGVLALGRGELDKLSKRLRRWPGDVGVVLEYEHLPC